ncbi:protein of unknown function - conserved [Leishmania donovani]|nr:hypothetical_protein_-_conserved [Leishmania infantum]CAJ1988797.1 protein of unknown function - conserved [Leishmania donovani]SUZ41797.1 hypothetical_protein_-_conserved [Leishmania infantum]
MQQSHANNMVRNTAAATSTAPSANCASSDTLFRLECMLLFALDVVRGPYIHSCAPAHPPEAIRSFLESQAAPASPSSAAAPYSAAAAAASPAVGAEPARRGSLPLPPPPSPDLKKVSAEMIGDDTTRMSPAGSNCDAATAVPYTKMANAAMHPSPSFGACSIGGGDGGLVDASPALELGSLQHSARTPLLKEQRLSPLSLANRAGAAAGLSASMLGNITGGDVCSVSFSPVAQSHLVGLRDTTGQTETRALAVDTSGTNHAASEDSAAFSLSPQTCTNESQLTPPRPSPKVGSSALAASPSIGGGDAPTAGISPGEYSGEPAHTNAGHYRDARSEVAHALERRTNVDSGTTPTRRLPEAPAVTTTTDAHCSNTSSPNATPVSTPPMTTAPPSASINRGVAVPGAATERCAVTEGQQQLPHHRHPQHLLPSSPQVWPSLHLTTTAATRGTPLPPTSTTAATTAADNGRMSGYNDVFVPRSEFCRRVLWLYPAESGLLFLYYPEDIPGEHYQRKTLRYSLCLVFRVDHKQITIGDGLLHQLVHPYSVVLTNIAEELREAELKYAYMIRGLRSFDSASWQMSRLALKSPIPSLPTTATTAFNVAAQSPVASFMAGAHVAEVAEDADEGVGQAHLATPPELPSSALQKPCTLLGGRVTGQADTTAPSTTTTTAVAMTAGAIFNAPSSTSASPNSYHPPFLEHSGAVPAAVSVAVAAGGTNRLHPPAKMADRTSSSLMSPQQPAAPPLGDEGTEAHGSAEAATATISGGCSSQQCEDSARVAKSRRDGDGGSLASGVHGCGDSSPNAITAAAASHTAHASSSHCSISFSPPTGAHIGSSGGSTAATAGDSGIRSSSSYLTNMESLEIAITPPSSSSLPVRSRTISETAATFHFPLAQPRALEESASMAASGSAACSSFSLTAAPASVPYVALGGAVKAHCGGGRQQQHSMAGASAATPPRVPSPFQGPAPTTAVASMHILNAFITPPTEPKWTPLSELVDELFRCLSYTEAPDGNGDRERDGQVGSPAADGRTPLTASPTPAGAALGLAAQQPEGALGEEMSSKALAQRSISTTSASPTGQQQQRGDTSVVHLSNRLSFHVRRMAPLQPARLLHFDHVPVPVVAYDPQMMEWMDMAVHHVFRLVDGVRTVADLVFSVAMGTTTTLAEVYADALQRSVAEQQAAPVTAQSTTSASAGASAAQRSTTAHRDRARGAAVKVAAPLSAPGTAAAASAAAAVVEVHGSGESAAEAANVAGRGASAAGSPSQSIVVSVPIDIHPCPSLLPGVRYPAPTSAAAAISDGQAPLPSHVNVRVTPGAAMGAGAPDTSAPVRSGANGLGTAVPIASGVPDGSSVTYTTASSLSPPQISVELPQTWVATAGIVMEALLHLELCHLIKVYRPWTEGTLYSTTHSAQRVLRSVHHPARHVLGHYLLCMAWTERQEWRETRRASVASRIATSVVAEKQRASTPLRMASTPQQSSTAAEVSSPPSSTAPATALAIMPASGVGSRAAATKAAVAVRSPDRLMDRSGWSPPASPRLPSSVPCASEMHRSGQQQQLPHPPPPLTPVAYPRSPYMPYLPQSDSVLMGVGAAHAGGLDPSSTDTHVSSASTSLAPSPLRHALSIGASGRLQLTLMSSLPTFSLQRSGASSGGAMSGTSQRFSVGSQGSQTCGGGLLPCAATGVSYGRSYSQQQQQRWHQHFYVRGCSHAAPLRSCSSTSSSEDSCASVSRRSSSSASSSVSSDSGHSSVSSSSSSSSANPMPISASAMQPVAALSIADASAAQTSATPAKVEAPGLSSLTPAPAGESMPAQASKGAAAADGVSRSAQHPLKSPSGDGAAIERPAAEPTAASAIRAAESQAAGVVAAEASRRQKRRRRRPSLKVFAPTEADVNRAAAAALCALAKFNNASVLSVQEEMRRIPVCATSFNDWSDRCVKALVEVAVLNNWLEDVS